MIDQIGPGRPCTLCHGEYGEHDPGCKNARYKRDPAEPEKPLESAPTTETKREPDSSIKVINFTSLMGDPSKIVACRGSDGSVIINRKKTYWYLPKDAMTELCQWYQLKEATHAG